MDSTGATEITEALLLVPVDSMSGLERSVALRNGTYTDMIVCMSHMGVSRKMAMKAKRALESGWALEENGGTGATRFGLSKVGCGQLGRETHMAVFGDFAKACMKLSATAKEIIAMCETLVTNAGSSALELAHTLGEVDALILKHIATTQSLYL
jgi:hypothetical protein